MQFSKGFVARIVRRKDMVRDDAFTTLLSRLEALPSDQRGPQALSLSASLLEMAAYELAGSVTSGEVAEMIETAAELTRRSTEWGSAAEPLAQNPGRRLN